MTVQGTTISDNTAVDPTSSAVGGGILNEGGTLLLNHCTITGNSASGGAGGPGNKGANTVPSPPAVAQPGHAGYNGYPAAGGGIFNAGTLTIQKSVISGNQANGGAGGTGGAGGNGLSGAAPSYESGATGGAGGTAALRSAAAFTMAGI